MFPKFPNAGAAPTNGTGFEAKMAEIDQGLAATRAFLAKNYPEIVGGGGGAASAPSADVSALGALLTRDRWAGPTPRAEVSPLEGSSGGATLPSVGRPQRGRRGGACGPGAAAGEGEAKPNGTMSVSEMLAAGFALNDLLDYYRDSDDRRVDLTDRADDNMWRDRDREFWKGYDDRSRSRDVDDAFEARRALEDARRADERRRIADDERRAAELRRADDADRYRSSYDPYRYDP
jgi:hypothetical protein